jgi:hypothetical protein
MMIELYDETEVNRINKAKETNDRLEEFFTDKREEWNNNTKPLFESIQGNFTLESSIRVVEIQSLALSYRQMINDQISFFLNKRSKGEVKLKKIKQDKFIFYATGFGLKTNLGEKMLLIEAHIAENERNIQVIDSHIDYLRTTSKNLESLGYTIKNIIDLMNYLSK